jgi:transcriptional regulator with XRE-family HTH domain
VDDHPPASSPDTDTEPVGAALARLRRDKGLSGRQLGDLVGLSQASVSRIETGATAPDPALIGRLAAALDAPPDVVRSLTTRAEQAGNEMSDWRLRPVRVGDIQQDYADLEASSRVIRGFQAALPHALIQTSEYARSLFVSVQPQWTDDGPFESSGFIANGVAGRVNRQKILADPRRRFHFLMSEAALLYRLCPPTDMPAQIQRIRDVSRQKNVNLRIIPMDVRWACPPIHGFEIFDDRCVATDLFNTIVISRGRGDVRIYLKIFADLEAQAVADIDPILDRHLDRYLDLARTSRATAP